MIVTGGKQSQLLVLWPLLELGLEFDKKSFLLELFVKTLLGPMSSWTKVSLYNCLPWIMVFLDQCLLGNCPMDKSFLGNCVEFLASKYHG